MRPVASAVGVDKAGMGSWCGAGGGQCGCERAPKLEEARWAVAAACRWTRWAAVGAVSRGGACPNLSEWVRAGVRGR
jgi:hypothetical protein